MADPIKNLVALFSRLPGIGEKSALRLVHHMLLSERSYLREMATALVDVADHVGECPVCCTLSASAGPCAICADPRRDPHLLCVVSSMQDLSALEATGEFRGRYHVLHGTLAPLDGVGPDQLRIRQLFVRLQDVAREVTEIILATPPSVDGEATALFLSRQLDGLGLKVTRIASGVPVGGDLAYADRLTLSRALALRRAV